MRASTPERIEAICTALPSPNRTYSVCRAFPGRARAVSIGLGSTRALPGASSARQKFLRKPTESLQRGERRMCAIKRPELLRRLVVLLPLNGNLVLRDHLL